MNTSESGGSVIAPYSAKVVSVDQSDRGYPTALETYLGERAPKRIFTIGDQNILLHKTLALFCSVKCPGNLILRTYDLVRQLRDEGTAVIGGFHTPMEKEMLNILLKGTQLIVICPARSIDRMRPPKGWKEEMEKKRLLILSPFRKDRNRVTAALAEKRNRFVAAIADRVFVAYANPGGKTEALCRQVLEWGKPLLTFDSVKNVECN